MLKPGGTLVYSTCTYALEEDEDVVLDFLEKHEDMVLVDPEVSWGRKGFKDLNAVSYTHLISLLAAEIQMPSLSASVLSNLL